MSTEPTLLAGGMVLALVLVAVVAGALCARLFFRATGTDPRPRTAAPTDEARLDR